MYNGIAEVKRRLFLMICEPKEGEVPNKESSEKEVNKREKLLTKKSWN